MWSEGMIARALAVNFARLASLRMWDKIAVADGHKGMAEYWREKALSNKEAS